MSPHDKRPRTGRSSETSSGNATASNTDSGNSNDSPSGLQATRNMCFSCFDRMIDALQNPSHYTQDHHYRGSKRKQAVPAFASELPDVTVECPVFVTWDKQHSSRSHRQVTWHLRGCIGTLSPRLLVDAVGEYALISAFKDRRFSPIHKSEVPSLRVSVSLLVCYEPCEDAYDWTVGVHGIIIKFLVDGQSYSATYLPDVALEQGWTVSQTVASLIQKAGYHGAVTAELLRGIKCTRYQSSKCQVTFGEYVLERCQGDDPMLAAEDSNASGNESTSSWSSCKQM